MPPGLTQLELREFWSQECKHDQHQNCDGYYPPGPDTYTCHCPCHNQRRAAADSGRQPYICQACADYSP